MMNTLTRAVQAPDGVHEHLATTLEEKAGYEEGRDLFGAPYDFRYGLAGPGHPSQVGSAYL